MSLKPQTFLTAAAIAAVALGLAWVAFRPQPVPVDLHTVAEAPMRITINADGQTRIREVYEISAPIAGTARRSPVAVGDQVRGGQTVVAEVEPAAPALLDTRTRTQAEAALRESEAALRVAESDLRTADEDLTYAQSQYERARNLFDRGTATLARLEDAERRLAVATSSQAAAQSRLEMALGAVDRARATLIEPGEADTDGTCCVSLVAPADGVVLDLAAESARPVVPGAPLLSIGDPADLEIVADLLSSDAVRVGPGTRAIVERWGGPDPLEAVLRRVEPAARTHVSALGIEEQRVDVIFDLVSPPEDRPGLGHGFSVFLRVVEWEQDRVLQVPLSAVFRDGDGGDGWAVFVAANGVARLRPVALGRRSATVVEVLDGLDPAEQVVTHPSDALTDGSAIVERAALR